MKIGILREGDKMWCSNARIVILSWAVTELSTLILFLVASDYLKTYWRLSKYICLFWQREMRGISEYKQQCNPKYLHRYLPFSLFMPLSWKVARYYALPTEILSFHPFICSSKPTSGHILGRHLVSTLHRVCFILSVTPKKKKRELLVFFSYCWVTFTFFVNGNLTVTDKWKFPRMDTYWVSVSHIFIILCLLHNSDTIWDIFMKIHTNVKHHETMSRTHES